MLDRAEGGELLLGKLRGHLLAAGSLQAFWIPLDGRILLDVADFRDGASHVRDNLQGIVWFPRAPDLGIDSD